MSRRNWPEEVVKLPPGEWVKDGPLGRLRFVPAPGTPDDWTENPRPAAQCGTYAGYLRHHRHRTPTCDECREANRAEVAKKRPPTPRELKPHGTHAAFNRHKKHNEEPCDECRTAENAYQQAHRRTRKKVAA